MSSGRIRVEPVEWGPTRSHDARLTIASGHDVAGGWRVIVALRVNHAIPAGDLVTADFDAGDVDELIRGLGEARDAVRAAELERPS